MERFSMIPSCYLVIMKDGKIVLLRRFNTGYKDGMYSMISGHLNGEETFRQAMAREAKEEAGITIRPEDMEIVHTIHRSKKDNEGERIDIFLKVEKWEGELKNAEPDKCDEIGWFDADSLPENIIPYIKQAIECIKKGVIYSEYGW